MPARNSASILSVALILCAVLAAIGAGIGSSQEFRMRRPVQGLGNAGPEWQTEANLGTVAANAAFSRTLLATDREHEPVTYGLASGSNLPPGLGLGTGGLLSGTTPDVPEATLYTFTIGATDTFGNVTRREFALQVTGTQYSYTAWSDFGACPASCGDASHSRTRSCLRSGDGASVNCSLCGGQCEESSSCQVTSGCAYQWNYGGWGSCSNSCGDGNQTRSASCQWNYNGSFVDAGDDSACIGQFGPALTSQSCQSNSGCNYQWVYGAWGACSNSCGDGTQTRSVTDCLRDWNGTPQSASQSECTSVLGAAVTGQACNDVSACGFTWQVGDWGACAGGSSAWQTDVWTICSNSCGSGTQTRLVSCEPDLGSGSESRAVTCKRDDGATVADASCEGAVGPKPATAQACTPTADCTGQTEPASSQACTEFPPPGSPYYGWVVDTYGSCSAVCAKPVSAYHCTRACDGANLGNDTVNCTDTAPASGACSAGEGACGYSWQVSGGCTGSCTTGTAGCSDSLAGTCSADYVCKRADGTTVADGFCTGSKPTTTSCGTASSTATCSYQWTGATYPGTCSGGGTQSCGSGSLTATSATCQWTYPSGSFVNRPAGSGGNTAPCGTAGALPSQACTYPSAGASNYQWIVDSYGTCNTACSKAVTAYHCQRNCDSANLGNDTTNCNFATPGAGTCTAGQGSCSYSWQLSGGCTGGCTTSSGCGSAVSGTCPATYVCKRADGTTVADGLCSGGKPTTTSCTAENIAACSYQWTGASYPATALTDLNCSSGGSYTCGTGSQTATSATCQYFYNSAWTNRSAGNGGNNQPCGTAGNLPTRACGTGGCTTQDMYWDSYNVRHFGYANPGYVNGSKPAQTPGASCQYLDNGTYGYAGQYILTYLNTGTTSFKCLVVNSDGSASFSGGTDGWIRRAQVPGYSCNGNLPNDPTPCCESNFPDSGKNSQFIAQAVDTDRNCASSWPSLGSPTSQSAQNAGKWENNGSATVRRYVPVTGGSVASCTYETGVIRSRRNCRLDPDRHTN